MKLRKTLPIGIALGILILLTGFSSTASAQIRPSIADSGLILLGENETLGATVVGTCDGIVTGAGPGAGPHVRYRMLSYGIDPGVSGIHRVVSEDTSQTIVLRSNEASVLIGLLLPAVQRTGARLQVEVSRCSRFGDTTEVHFEKIILTGGVRKKEYVGHVTLNK